MIIHIQEESLEFENDPKMIEKYFDTINEILKKKDLQFSHLIIDGVPIYEDFMNYFTDHIDRIKKVEVAVQTIENLLNDTILSTYDYIQNGIIVIKPLAEAFYQRPDSESWKKLTQLFEGIQWIIEVLARIDAIRNLDSLVTNYGVWNEYVQAAGELSSIMPVIEEAMVNKDNVLIGDVLLYEIVPIFKKMKEKLQFLIPRKGSINVS
ncbi:hypothetical protein GH808_11305 [Acetobacterium fimetarium]|uniref:Uncharacterized protein n=1 Tax=Acetobacterium fimetarium TaxID=52691 RepID=A0ABR6WX40_9FIRM|nr:hypothetical protein [Acetobacterium fimetarium]MBC3805018.1 hypothetical protein [Acetobacterium fimetarium]